MQVSQRRTAKPRTSLKPACLLTLEQVLALEQMSIEGPAPIFIIMQMANQLHKPMSPTPALQTQVFHCTFETKKRQIPRTQWSCFFFLWLLEQQILVICLHCTMKLNVYDRRDIQNSWKKSLLAQTSGANILFSTSSYKLFLLVSSSIIQSKLSLYCDQKKFIPLFIPFSSHPIIVQRTWRKWCLMGREVMSQKLKTQLNNSYLSIEKFTSKWLAVLVVTS